MESKTNIEIALTTHCQAKCRSCARTDLDTGEKVPWLKLEHFPLSTYTTILNSTKRHISDVKFCGEFGDPMMHPQVKNFINETFKYNPEMTIDINTNGGLRNQKFYRELASWYPKTLRLHWGIDGADHDTNWKYREGVDFERAMTNMKTWFNWNGAGDWHFIIFAWNYKQIPLVKQMAEDIGCAMRFKYNVREFGRITSEQRKHAEELLGDAHVM